MQVSARTLGKDYGLTAEEMNRVLLKQGFLQGIPGDYSVTQKAMQYAIEKDFHRGTGGYACYNRYWTTSTYDDSIKEVLDVSADLINEVRSEIAADRKARNILKAAARSQADAEALAKQTSEQAAHEAAKTVSIKTEELIFKSKNVGKIGLVIGGVFFVGYCVYKAAPLIRRLWDERNHTDVAENGEA